MKSTRGSPVLRASSSSSPVISAAMTAARDRIMDFLHEQEIGEPEEIDILVALQEALANAVLHGCHSDPSQVIRCSVEVDAEAVTIVIADPGPGFDTNSICAATEAPPISPITGAASVLCAA